VHTSVELVKQSGRTWDAGFVNGLLRRAAAREAVEWPDPDSSPGMAVAARHALPLWLAARWIDRFGIDETVRLCEAVNTVPAITLRVNTLKTDRVRLTEAVRAEVRQIAPAAHTPEGVTLSGLHRPVTEWPAFRDGWFQVQDEAAQMIAHLVSPEPGHTVWDACAGLGTKTAHLAQLMRNEGAIWATDRHAGKLERLQDEMRRLGVTITTCRRLDATAAGALAGLPRFDRILVDAPCSGLGVLQKNPDGKWKVTRADLESNRKRQLTILENACALLRMGGRLIYAVCSFEPEETLEVVKAFLQNHPDFAIHPPMIKSDVCFERVLTPEGWLKTYPHRHGMDGFHAVALVRIF
jgi:16S rRNA (cytosine967-C5)-methyltransferase